MGGLVGDGNPGVTETAPGIGFDAQRGSGLPLCKRDAYHNRAFQLMSRMCLVSFYGDALDEKTPLLRSMKSVSTETTRLMKNLGYSVDSVVPNIGLEQEFFLIPRKELYRRPDLQLTGRTIMVKNAPRGQEMCDHYMAAPNEKALACMREIQNECFKVGIPMQTRHKEVAPNQYEP